MNAKDTLSRLFSSAGITVNGSNAWDIQVHNEHFYTQVLATGSLGLGESYMSNWWDSPRLDEFFHHLLRGELDTKAHKSLAIQGEILFSRLFNRQNPASAYRNAVKHYDLGNDLFTQMLDRRMVYTCGFWKNAQSLNEAQEYKLDLSCRKLQLKPGMHVLDIGCGWGSFAKYAAEKYQVKVTGITLSKEQAELGRQLCKGLPVDIQLMDYRQLGGQYDAIASLGMFEHVGLKNYRIYMQTVFNCLRDEGLFLLHTIGSNHSTAYIDPWINKYIFPHSLLPSIRQIGKAIEGLFVMEHWENFSTDYDKTLSAWFTNFSSNWNKLKAKYDDTFYRMWKYYLLSCAGSFRARKNQLWQLVLSRKGVEGGYRFS
ncbi:cyclopropane fatty acyl phospholipid synthase [Chitinophaga alhagiae]|uniref:cyclopropane fatty acyl phospholipid synthase n=1 Tax=Chitinophaga alhagiae TaxID=2203219 RepID=UPI001E3E9773|nr:cyclopropane fatty acyl phospholipid synthase [Chitinophaga alhagiae]